MLLSDIFEAFSTAPDMKFIGAHATEYHRGLFDTRFEVNGETYLVTIGQEPHDDYFTPLVWDVSFRQLSSPGYSPTKNVGSSAPAVFGGVTAAMTRFMADEQPNAIGFSGARKDGLGQLYAKMVRHMAPKIAALGYRLHTAVQNTGKGELDTILLYRGDDITDYIKA